MGRIAHTSTSEIFSHLDAAAKELGDTNDCTVKLIATLTGIPYLEANERCERKGRTKGKGFGDWIEVFEDLGYTLETMNPQDFIQQYPGVHKGLQNVTTHHPDRFKSVWKDGHNYVFQTRSHVAAVIDGENLDWTKGRAKRVLLIYKVKKV